MNEPTAQMGFQVGKSAMAAGQEYMENNVCNIERTLYLPFIANLEIIHSSIAMSLYQLSSTTLTSPTPTS